MHRKTAAFLERYGNGAPGEGLRRHAAGYVPLLPQDSHLAQDRVQEIFLRAWRQECVPPRSLRWSTN